MYSVVYTKKAADDISKLKAANLEKSKGPNSNN